MANFQNFMNDPWSQSLMGLGSGLLQAAGPSRIPVSTGQALGQGLLGMQSGYMQAIQNGLWAEKIAEKKKKKENEQKLIEAIGTPPQIAGQDMVENRPGSGYLGGQVTLEGLLATAAQTNPQIGLGGLVDLEKTRQPAPFTLSPGQTRFDPQGNPVAFGGADPEMARKQSDERIKNANIYRDEYNALTKDFRIVNDSYQRIEASVKDPSAAGDLSLIFNYMKMLDPNSVVRESEFATAAATGSYGERVQGMVNKIMSGQRLSDDVRKDFEDRASLLYKAQGKNVDQLTKQYTGLAQRAGVNPKDVIVDYRSPQFSSPEEVRDAVRSRKIKKEEGISILQKEFGMK